MRLLFCLVCLLPFPVEETRAQTATFEFSGHISYVGTPLEFPEIASVFRVGRPYTLSYTFDLTTPDSWSDPSSGLYYGAITAASFNYDNSTYVGVMDPATMSGTIRTGTGSEADNYIMVFGLGTNIFPSFNESSAEPTFPPISGFNFSGIRLNLTGPPSFLLDDGLHPALNLEAAANDPLSFMSVYFRKVLNPISYAVSSINGTLETLRVVREETNAVPRAYLNQLSSFILRNFDAVRFAVHGPRAFVVGHGDGQHELRVIDLSDPLHPRQVSRRTLQGWPLDIQATSNHVLISVDHEPQVQIFENRDTPRLLGSFNFALDLGEIEVTDNFAYVVWQRGFSEGGLNIIDISNPHSPRLVSTWTAPHGVPYGLAVANNVAYVGGGRYVDVLDVSNPAQPQWINAIPTPNPGNDVVVAGNYAYISVYTNGVQIVDVSNPTRPRTIAAARLANTGSLAVTDNYLLIRDEFAGLRLVDVSQPGNPVLVDTFSGRDSFDVRIVGTTVYTLDYFGLSGHRETRLSVLRIGPTARPRLFVPHVGVAEDSGTHQIPIRIEDPDSPLDAVAIEVDSDSPVITRPRLVSQEGGSNAISFRTRADRYGVAPFTVRVTHPDGESVRESFHLHVSPEDDEPPAVIGLSSPSFVKVGPGHFRVTAFGSGVANVTLQANGPTDVDGDRLAYIWFGDAPWTPISFQRTLHRRLSPGTYNFRVELTDGNDIEYSIADVRVDVVPAHPQLRIPHRSGLISRPLGRRPPGFRPPPLPNRR